MSNAQIRPLPNIGAVDPRIPSFDPRSADSIRYTDCSARRHSGRRHALRARLWVRRGERWNTDGQLSVLPNVRAVDPGVRGGNGSRLQGKLGLDRGAATHELVLSGTTELERFRELTKFLQPDSGSSASHTRAQMVRCSCMARREHRWGSRPRYLCRSSRSWQP